VPVANPPLRAQGDRYLAASGCDALLECWREHEAKGGMRVGRDIPSRALAKLLPYILIAEPVGSWGDARIRLAGTALMERFGRDVAGEVISDAYAEKPDGASSLLAAAHDAAENRHPGLIDLRILMDEIEVFHLETVLLPIQSPDGTARWSLVGAFQF
jgi:hypothetical protein